MKPQTTDKADETEDDGIIQGTPLCDECGALMVCLDGTELKCPNFMSHKIKKGNARTQDTSDIKLNIHPDNCKKKDTSGVNYKNLICPKCGKMFDVWNYKTDNTMFEGCCNNCLIDIHIEWKEMDDESIRELARM